MRRDYFYAGACIYLIAGNRIDKCLCDIWKKKSLTPRLRAASGDGPSQPVIIKAKLSSRSAETQLVLNYTVTSNPVHLIVKEDSDHKVIPQAVGLIAGRTAQEYNRHKRRKGDFWEDRYHSTAIENGEHLLRCLVYIDLNMVRAGVVAHPFQSILSRSFNLASPYRPESCPPYRPTAWRLGIGIF